MEPNTTTRSRNVQHTPVPFSPLGTRSHNRVNPVVLPLNDEKSRIKVALDKFSYLKAGWDGLEALPVSKGVLSNVSLLLAISDNKDWKGWLIEPNINGTVILRSGSRMAGISIGIDSFSYYHKEGKNVMGRDSIVFSAEEVLSVMRTLNT